MVPSRVAVSRPHPRRGYGYDTRVSTVHVDAKEQLKPKCGRCQDHIADTGKMVVLRPFTQVVSEP